MKIAVTYENGEVFQHFGHTSTFKIYEVKDNKVLSSEIVPTNGSGHGALSAFLEKHGVNKLICGGIGSGAKTALAENGPSKSELKPQHTEKSGGPDAESRRRTAKN